MGILYKYLAEGVIESGIVEDGGQACYDEIPLLYQLVASTLAVLLHAVFVRKWHDQLSAPTPVRKLPPNFVQVSCGVLGLISLAFTFYYKLITHKLAFIFNPCHVTILVQSLLLLLPNTVFAQKVHTYWTAWVFGGMMALMVPHLEGISSFEVLLYYVEHGLIFPFGPLLLYRRYGFLTPTFTNQLASFSSLCIYQLTWLLFISRTTMVNMNFVLCHTPADPAFPHIGYHYVTAAILVLNIISWVGRWICYAIVFPLAYVRPVKQQ